MGTTETMVQAAGVVTAVVEMEATVMMIGARPRHLRRRTRRRKRRSRKLQTKPLLPPPPPITISAGLTTPEVMTRGLHLEALAKRRYGHRQPSGMERKQLC